MKLIALWIFSLSFFSDSYAYTPGKTYKLTILHTNDHHGRFWANKDGEFGLAARATIIQEIRESVKSNGGHVLLLDAGDVNTGVPQSDLLNAEPDFKGMALLGYDVMAVGNHEFDNELPVIFKQREWAGFPFISANIYDRQMKRVFPSHIVKKLEDLNVTVFGLTTEDTPYKTNPLNTKGLTFIPAVEEAKTLVPILRKKADVLIALTHMGHHPNESHGADAPGDVTLARKVNGIDLIVGGHTQKPLFEPDIQNGSIIVQAAEWGKYVGRVDLEFLDGKLTLKKAQLIPVNHKDSPSKIQADPYIEAILKPFKDQGDRSLLIELGSADSEFIGKREIVRFKETNLGNLVASAFRSKFNTDIGIINSGGLRDSLYPGKVTYESVLMVLPFGGEVGVARMSGKDLLKYMEHLVFELKPGSGSFPQISGVDIEADKDTGKILKFMINGNPLKTENMYTLALPEFIGNGGDKYPKIDFQKTGFVDADVLKEFVLKVKELKNSDYAPKGYIRFTN